MKPTYAMQLAVFDAILSTDVDPRFVPQDLLRRIGRGLEAALADVPELTAFERAALGQHGRDKDRIAALEAKLAKVRAVLDMTRRLTPDVMALCDQLARALADEEAKP